MDARRLFAHVVDDLAERMDHPDDEYQMIRASGLLRLLLLDSPTLLSLAHPPAQSRRVRFEVLDIGGPSLRTDVDVADRRGNSGLVMMNFVPLEEGSPVAKRLRLDAFLAFPLASSNVTEVGRLSVRDVIHVGAVAFGGVHFDTPRSLEEQYVEGILRDWDPISDGDVSALCGMLGKIATVTVRALWPLAHGV